MKRSLLSFGVVVAGAMVALLPLSSASAVNETGCGTHDDFVKVWYDNGDRTACYANAGYIAPQLPNVYRISSGNNNIEFLLGDNEVRTLGKYQNWREVDGRTLTLLHVK
ncbi:beta/gamma crystallin domain-containing protein [Streptomyces sp. NPDC006622]|uniref:beta/gamma crystallin domain-containing protein n=1 Tax=Streptomyces sp. NPDC006622 TaxID=3155459 RepID=UPI0033BE77AB